MGQGRAPLWLPYRNGIKLPVRSFQPVICIAVSDCAGLDAAELPAESGDESETFAGCVNAAVQELAKKDLVYLHAGLSDDVLHATDIHDKVQAIERFRCPGGRSDSSGTGNVPSLPAARGV